MLLWAFSEVFVLRSAEWCHRQEWKSHVWMKVTEQMQESGGVLEGAGVTEGC